MSSEKVVITLDVTERQQDKVVIRYNFQVIGEAVGHRITLKVPEKFVTEKGDFVILRGTQDRFCPQIIKSATAAVEKARSRWEWMHRNLGDYIVESY